ncbi:hypothetical protein GAS19_08045 [Burkholderia glumae]|uniref:Uncharacterized protein n=2 Tax=Burkholderia glumae TaxID=337 RepID=A0ABY5BDJ9_BURGL|nr:hypothetical protein [Burkholderia glumae]QGA37605.1 hypothetical protein GAS19_08045 [Burkholderia glumae]USS44593.1 hypothetical protein NFI99_23485 [Burkholderia glumae]
MKIDRARSLLVELEQLVRDVKVFEYIVETDYQIGRRWTRAREIPEASEKISAVVGDVLQNLRSALDHAFWDVVSPHAEEKKKRDVQFPYSRDADGWGRQLETRSVDKVSEDFYEYIKSLRVYPGGGSENLVMVHEFNIRDKHRSAIPLCDFKKITSSDIAAYVHDFPRGFFNCSLGGAEKDFGWSVPVRPLPKKKMRGGAPSKKIACRVIPVDVGVCFQMAGTHQRVSVNEFLSPVIDEIETVVKKIHSFA